MLNANIRVLENIEVMVKVIKATNQLTLGCCRNICSIEVRIRVIDLHMAVIHTNISSTTK